MKRAFNLLLTIALLAIATLASANPLLSSPQAGGTQCILSPSGGEIERGPETVTTKVQEHGYFDLVATDAQGNIKWQELDVPNALANEGEYLIQDVLFRGNTPPTQFYLRLYNTTPGLTSTLSTLAASEPATANGYAPASQGITRDSTGWPLVPQLVSSHYEITSKTITITASGGAIGPVTYAVLSTTSDNTGKLVAYAALSATRTLQIGDSLAMTYKIRLQ